MVLDPHLALDTKFGRADVSHHVGREGQAAFKTSSIQGKLDGIHVELAGVDYKSGPADVYKVTFESTIDGKTDRRSAHVAVPMGIRAAASKSTRVATDFQAIDAMEMRTKGVAMPLLRGGKSIDTEMHVPAVFLNDSSEIGHSPYSAVTAAAKTVDVAALRKVSAIRVDWVSTTGYEDHYRVAMKVDGSWTPQDVTIKQDTMYLYNPSFQTVTR